MNRHDESDSQHQEEACIGLPKHHEMAAVSYVPDTEEERRLVRKIDTYLLPALWGMYLLSYMDRTKSVPIITQERRGGGEINKEGFFSISEPADMRILLIVLAMQR